MFKISVSFPNALIKFIPIFFFGTALMIGPAKAQDLRDFLRQQLNFTEADLAALDQGQTISKLPKTNDKREVAAFGVMRLNASRESFVEAFRDIASFKKGPNVLQIGKFSDPPRLEDLRQLQLPSEELRTIKQCRIGDCDLKLSAAAINRFRTEVNWQAPDYAVKANELFRQILVDYGRTYLIVGDDALIEYHDKSSPLRLADEFRSLLQASPSLSQHAPEVHQYLLEFPNAITPNVENFIYWSLEKFGLKPVLSLTHVAIYKRVRNDATDILITSKQIYASHYFDASLGLTAFIDEKDASGASQSFLIYLNRSRADALRGGFSGMKRSLIQGRVRSGMEQNMRLIRRKLEAGTIGRK